jgi:hypothetical protein
MRRYIIIMELIIINGILNKVLVAEIKSIILDLTVGSVLYPDLLAVHPILAKKRSSCKIAIELINNETTIVILTTNENILYY